MYSVTSLTVYQNGTGDRTSLVINCPNRVGLMGCDKKQTKAIHWSHKTPEHILFWENLPSSTEDEKTLCRKCRHQ